MLRTHPAPAPRRPRGPTESAEPRRAWHHQEGLRGLSTVCAFAGSRVGALTKRANPATRKHANIIAGPRPPPPAIPGTSGPRPDSPAAARRSAPPFPRGDQEHLITAAHARH